MKNKLKTALKEKDVENIYRSELIKLVPQAKITSPYGLDGLFEHGNLRMLLEFKFEEQMKLKLPQCNVLIQALYYLKKFEVSGEKLPNIVFVGDINECFALHSNAIVNYLSSEINWNIAPSEAHKQNPVLLQAMVNDTNILPFVFDINDSFSLKSVLEQLKDLSDNVIRKIRVTEHNITSIFEYFDKNVLGDKSKLSTNEKANLFVQLLIDTGENYLHPKKKNLLVSRAFGEIAVNSNLYASFFKHFEGEVYSPKEKEKLTGFVDRLVEDTVRRRKGEFFTPTIWVDEAHKYISDTFGSDWKDKYVVWDCACGTLNLTRDYKFKELYCSTLEQSDIDTANHMGYNQEAVKFQYDFLNDGINTEGQIDVQGDIKLPQGLKDAILIGKPILFLINPPYGTANNMGTTKGDHKSGIATTKLQTLMKNEKYGASSQQLYAQFLYRIQKIKQTHNLEVGIGLFSPPLFLSGSSYKEFRDKFLAIREFRFQKGFLFKASNFSDVAQEWGISFTIFKTYSKEEENMFSLYNLDIKELNKNTFTLDSEGQKELCSTDFLTACSDWVRKETKGLKTFDAPQISSALKIKDKGRGNIINNALGYMVNSSNNIYYNESGVSIFSSCFSNGNGLSITKENFHKITTLFTARKTIDDNWINSKDEYRAPDETHPKWNQFVNDSIIHSLFDVHSQQSSLRQITYKNKLWDIKNEFFWMSKVQMMELSEKAKFDELYRDAKTSDERFVYNKLFGTEALYSNLSPLAKEVLDMANNLIVKSMAYRKIMAENNPEYQLNSWDAGYAQLKLVWKEYLPVEFKAFRDKYKQLEDFMRPQVYELGFLCK